MGHRSLVALVALLAVTGASCSEKKSIQGTSGNQALRVDLTFRDQVREVKAGRTNKIYVRQETIDDAHLLQLEGLDNLEVLNLPNGAMTDQGLAGLVGLPKLMLLRLSSPRVTDAGLAEIAKIRSLRFLHLIDVPITNAGLAHLQSMTRLESFYLDGGNTTDEGIEQLLKALPELHFHIDQQHVPNDPSRHEHD